MKIPFKIPTDKWSHLVIGGMIGLVLIPNIFFGFGFTGWLICLLIGFGKEAYDYKTKEGTPEVLDVVYTMIIPTLILIIHWIV